MKFFSNDGITLSRGVPTPFVIHWRGATSLMPGADRRRIIGDVRSEIDDDVGPNHSINQVSGASSTYVDGLTYTYGGYEPYRTFGPQVRWVDRSITYTVGSIMLSELRVWPGFDFQEPGYRIVDNRLLFIVARIRHGASADGGGSETWRDGPGEPGGLVLDYHGEPGIYKPRLTYLGYAISFFRSTSGLLRYTVEPKITYDPDFTQDWDGFHFPLRYGHWTPDFTIEYEYVNVAELQVIDATILLHYHSFLNLELPTIEFLQPGIPPSPHLMALPSDIGETGNQ